MAKKIESVNEFVEKMDAMKKKNPKDLSSDQDLTLAIMNLISIEEHLVFSGAKTNKTHYYDMIQDVRTLRTSLMKQIIPTYEGEVWCISKHLMSTAVRLWEVGMKQQSLGNNEKAYDLFNKSYDVYCLFWGINMGMVDTKDIKWQPTDEKELNKRVSELKVMNAVKATPAKNAASAPKQAEPETDGSMFGKFKAIVKKAVDCCIE